MAKNKLVEFVQNAADLCNRKRDTIYYSALTAGVGAANVFGVLSPLDMIPALSAGTAVREFVRNTCWSNAGGFREAAAANIVTSVALMGFTGTHILSVNLGGELMSSLGCFASTMAVASAGLSAGMSSLHHNLRWKDVAQLYRDKLFDYPDKKNPRPPRRPRKTSLILNPTAI